MPPGSAVNAASAAARRPFTSTMSSDGAPRANEIDLAMLWSLREAHVDDRAIGSLVSAYGHVAHPAQVRQSRLELAERLDARERTREQGHWRARRRSGLGAPSGRWRQHALVPDEQLAHRRHESLAELGERLDLVARVERRRRDRRWLGDGRGFGGRLRRWRLRGGRLWRRLGERRGWWRCGRRRVGGR